MYKQIYFEDDLICDYHCETVTDVKNKISDVYGCPLQDFYVTINGRTVSDNYNLQKTDNVIRVLTKLVGGKGGFGSMLRAIGAQIEKTTNREACRDLSGRRLRDINEEKRLIKWLEGQEEREKEVAERKQKKIEKLLAEPKINVELSKDYELARQELPERVSAAVEAGWHVAGSSNSNVKRKSTIDRNAKKRKLWIDAELSDCSLSEDEYDNVTKSNLSPVLSTDSGNESDKTFEIKNKTEI